MALQPLAKTIVPLLIVAAVATPALGFLQTAIDARTNGINSLDELNGENFLQRIVRLRVGTQQFASNPAECRRSTIGLLTGCARQYTYLVSSFGSIGTGRLFPPGFTEEMLTPEFLANMPLPPSRRCCMSAVEFQTNFCACNEETILAFRNWGFFDPLMTLPFANFLYGTHCGAPTFLADDCPNGSPFDTVGG